MPKPTAKHSGDCGPCVSQTILSADKFPASFRVYAVILVAKSLGNWCRFWLAAALCVRAVIARPLFAGTLCHTEGGGATANICRGINSCCYLI